MRSTSASHAASRARTYSRAASLTTGWNQKTLCASAGTQPHHRSARRRWTSSWQRAIESSARSRGRALGRITVGRSRPITCGASASSEILRRDRPLRPRDRLSCANSSAIHGSATGTQRRIRRRARPYWRAMPPSCTARPASQRPASVKAQGKRQGSVQGRMVAAAAGADWAGRESSAAACGPTTALAGTAAGSSGSSTGEIQAKLTRILRQVSHQRAQRTETGRPGRRRQTTHTAAAKSAPAIEARSRASRSGVTALSAAPAGGPRAAPARPARRPRPPTSP